MIFSLYQESQSHQYGIPVLKIIQFPNNLLLYQESPNYQYGIPILKITHIHYYLYIMNPQIENWEKMA